MIIRAPHNQKNPFFQMLRATAQDENLTARALGVLVYLLSKPDSWEPTVEDICNRFADVGQRQAYKIINETFIPLRYARRTQERKGGRIANWITAIYETPHGENCQVETPPDGSFDQPLDGDSDHVAPPDGDNHMAVSTWHLPDGTYQMAVLTTIDNTEETKQKETKQRRDITEEKKDMSGAIAPVVPSPVLEVFTYWQSRLNHPKSKLTPERQKKIKARLKDYTLEDIKQAIDGCASSPFHMGQSPGSDGTIHDDIELICRDGKHVEMFISKVNGRNGNSALNQFSPAAQQTIAALDGFVKRHMAKEDL